MLRASAQNPEGLVALFYRIIRDFDGRTLGRQISGAPRNGALSRHDEILARHRCFAHRLDSHAHAFEAIARARQANRHGPGALDCIGQMAEQEILAWVSCDLLLV